MRTLFLFICMATGITTIVTESRIFEGPRKYISKLGELPGYWIRCPLCFGFWCGLGLSFIPYFGMPWWIGGFVSSVWSYLYHCLTTFLNPED